MTPFQLISIAVLGGVVLVQYVLPHIKAPKKTNTMQQIESVIAIKESSTNPQVIEACSALLKALLG